MASTRPKFFALIAVFALGAMHLPAAASSSTSSFSSAKSFGSILVENGQDLAGSQGLAQSDAPAPSVSSDRASATELEIAAMMQMLRDEGIDIDARMQRVRNQCRDQVASASPDANAQEIDQAVEDCAVVEENIVYARAINEMNANRVDTFNSSLEQYNAQVAEAERKQLEYDRELEKHSAEVAANERQQEQFARELAAHELALGGQPDKAGSSNPSPSLAERQETANPNDPSEAFGEEATTPALASVDPSLPAEPVPSRATTSQDTAPSTSTGLARSTGSPAAQGRVLSQSDGSNSQDEIELAIMEATGPRIALIIGNEKYDGAMGSLANPVNDAVLIGATLRSLGFDVEILTNASQRDMKEAVQRLGDRLLAAGENATGLFYYAGHGVQSQGNNFLIPVGSAIDAESDLELEAVKADAILAQMEEAYVSTRIVILDACRNMPLRRRTRNGARGLARMETPNGSFVAYSTSPGSTAADGGGIHSPFAEALATQMLVPNRPIEVTFREVRRQVVELTNGDQVPWDSSSLLETFNFVTTQAQAM